MYPLKHPREKYTAKLSYCISDYHQRLSTGRRALNVHSLAASNNIEFDVVTTKSHIHKPQDYEPVEALGNLISFCPNLRRNFNNLYQT